MLEPGLDRRDLVDGVVLGHQVQSAIRHSPIGPVISSVSKRVKPTPGKPILAWGHAHLFKAIEVASYAQDQGQDIPSTHTLTFDMMLLKRPGE